MAGHLEINPPEAAKHLAKRVDRVFGTHTVKSLVSRGLKTLREEMRGEE
jgi:hypothetical protein